MLTRERLLGVIDKLREVPFALYCIMVYLWRVVDQEGGILESYITKNRDKEAALTFMKKALKRHGSPERSRPTDCALPYSDEGARQR